MYKIKSKSNNKKIKKGGDNKILLSSLMNLPNNYEVIQPGIITGQSIRSMSIINSFLTSVSSFIGTKQDWTGVEKILDNVRKEALEHLIKNTEPYLPDAIFGINIEFSEISLGKSNGLLVCSITGTMCRKKT